MSPQVDNLSPVMTSRPGEEQWGVYHSRVLNADLVQYDYRHTDGTPFSCVDRTLEKCRARRDRWLAMLPQPTRA